MRNKYLNTINRRVNGPDAPPRETDFFDVTDSSEYLENVSKNDENDLFLASASCDEVNNPAHYNIGAIECIDAIEAMLTFEEFVGYLRGNSLKYRWRFRYKDNPISDLSKASWYERKLFNFYEKAEENKGGQKGGKNGSF
tara:strand:- start:1996 stop:2415 length:420 start_codon:yes stop_codon:yes gene_type:complete